MWLDIVRQGLAREVVLPSKVYGQFNTLEESVESQSGFSQMYCTSDSDHFFCCLTAKMFASVMASLPVLDVLSPQEAAEIDFPVKER